MGLIKNLLVDRLGRRNDDFEWRTLQKPLGPATVKTVCILHTDDKLGDAIMNSALIDGLARAKPEIEITVGTSPAYASYWRACPGVSNVIVLPPRGVGRLPHRVRATRKVAAPYRDQFDVVVCFDPATHFDTFHLLNELRPKSIVGFNKDHYRLFDYSLNDHRYGPQMQHASERVTSVLKVLGVETPYVFLRQFVGYEESHAEESRQKLEGNTKRNYLFNTYGASASRTITLENSLKILRKLDQLECNAIVHLSVSKDQVEAYRAALMRERFIHVRPLVIEPMSSCFALFALVDQVDAVITPDTAIGHIAAAYDKPQVVLYRDSLYTFVHWLPLSDQCHAVLSTTDADVNDIDWPALDEALAKVVRIVEPDRVRSA